MVVDSSALIAILLGEEEAASFGTAIVAAGDTTMSAVSYVEASMVIWGRKHEYGLKKLDALIEEEGIRIIPVDHAQALAAREAFVRFGKGQHPARLNMGDCFSYALAKITGRPLLFKGDDFSRTDIAAAV